MNFKTVAIASAAAVLMLSMPARASAEDRCGDKACLMASHAQHAPAVTAETPARQYAKVWFMRPTQIGRHVLQGQYIVEHDTDRQARGEPCTYIYAANNRRVPVVTFHCTHLERPSHDDASVTVVSTGDISGLVKLTEFQFARDAAAHGVPSIR